MGGTKRFIKIFKSEQELNDWSMEYCGGKTGRVIIDIKFQWNTEAPDPNRFMLIYDELVN